jgi:preprotein translocase subunit SecY
MPYISASIIMQLLQTAVPQLESLKKEGEQGRKKLTQYTRYLTLALALVQGYAMASWFVASSSPDQRPLVSTMMFGLVPFQIMTMMTLAAGTCFVMWLGEQITDKGIGNGSSLIIFTGIAATIPGGATKLWESVSSGQMATLVALLVLVGMAIAVAAIVFIEVGQRRVPVQYSQRGAAKPGAQGQQAHLPLKLNFANVIPPIFASSLLFFPATMAQFIQAPWAQQLANSMTPTGAMYNVLFVALIVFFCFFYTEIVFNPTEVSDNLKKYGGFVPGIRAGKSTAEYLKRILDRLTVGGAAYLSAICILPTLVGESIGLPFHFNGTSILILVGVALDTSQQIQSHLLTAKYEGLKGIRIRSRRVQF